MKKTLTFLLFSMILISCGKNKYEKKLIGNWFEFKEGRNLRIEKDSLMISDIGFEKTTWNANENLINYNYKTFFNDSIIKVSLKYKLLKNDSLIIEPQKDGLQKIVLIKTNGYTDFLFRKNRINITLENNSKAEYQGQRNKYGIKIFVGFKNDSIIIKTEYSDNLKNLENDLEKKLIDLNPYFTEEYNEYMKERLTFNEWIRVNIHYCLFIDKNTPENVVSSILENLRKTKIKKIYRVFETKEQEGIPFDNLKKIKL